LIVALLLGALASGCRSGESGSPFSRRSNRPVRIQVDNHNFLNVTVYANAGGVSHRLGDVIGKNTESFSIDPRKISIVSGLRLRVEPIGSTRNFISEIVFPDGSSSVILTVAAELQLSYVILR
jgi:hypothetical protein